MCIRGLFGQARKLEEERLAKEAAIRAEIEAYSAIRNVTLVLPNRCIMCG